ncbi:MAG: sigma-70 family RNA polymerase sigma factor [bacterium]|nr:sigma-70 family RNA polymerase sigma factor [bacterium]
MDAIPPRIVNKVLVRSHGDFVQRLARALVSDDQTADDLVQQTWLVAMTRPPRHRDNVRAWLSRVVRSIARNRRRSEDRRCRHEGSVMREPGVSTPLDSMVWSEVVDRLHGALEQLSEEQREVLLLRFCDGRPVADIAHRIGVPVETVRSRLRRGMGKLRSHCKRKGEDERSWRQTLGVLLARLPSTERRAHRGSLAAARVLLVGGVGLVLLSVGTAWRSAFEGPPAVVPSSVAVASASPRLVAVAAPDAGEPRPLGTDIADPPPATGMGTIRARWSSTGLPANDVGLIVRRLDDLGGLERNGTYVTDAGGAVELAQLDPGRYRVEIDRGGSAEWEVLPGAARTVELELTDGIDLAGVVLDASGLPIADAALWLSWPGRPLRGWNATRTDANGAFTLRGLRATNWIGARAGGRPDSALRLVGEVGDREVVLRVRDAHGVLRGTVIGPHGSVVPGARITNETEGFLRPHRALDGTVRLDPPSLPQLTGEDGTFELPWIDRASLSLRVSSPGLAPWANIIPYSEYEHGHFAFFGCPSRGHRLWLFPPRAPAGAPLVPMARVDPVHPSSGPVCLRIGQEELGAITASLSTVEGLPPKDVDLVLTSPNFRSDVRCRVDPATGSVRVSGLLSGRYLVSLAEQKSQVRHVADVSLEPGETLRLGPLVLEPPGSLVLELRDPGGAPAEQFSVRVQGTGGVLVFAKAGEEREGFSFPATGVAHLEGLLPGSYQVTATQPGRPQILRQVHVRSEGITEADLQFTHGWPRRFEVALPRGLRQGSVLHASTCDERGIETARWSFVLHGGDNDTLTWEAHLTERDHVLDASILGHDRETHRGSASLSVTPRPDPRPITVDVHRREP